MREGGREGGRERERVNIGKACIYNVRNLLFYHSQQFSEQILSLLVQCCVLR